MRSPNTISNSIYHELRELILSNSLASSELALNPLSKHFQVSFTPIRAALSQLIEEGILEKLPTGRLTIVNPVDKALPLAIVNRPAVQNETELSENIFEKTLIAAIVSKSLCQKTDYLRESVVAERYGVGRTIVRQVFTRLVGKGLMLHIPRCGWRVRPYDEADMHSYIEVRVQLELLALTLAIPRMEQSELLRMLVGNQPSSDGNLKQIDNDLHSYLIKRSGNRYIADFFERNSLYHNFVFDYAAPEAHVVEEMAGQHRSILESLIQEDWEGARAHLKAHILCQIPIVKKMMSHIVHDVSVAPTA